MGLELIDGVFRGDCPDTSALFTFRINCKDSTPLDGGSGRESMGAWIDAYIGMAWWIHMVYILALVICIIIVVALCCIRTISKREKETREERAVAAQARGQDTIRRLVSAAQSAETARAASGETPPDATAPVAPASAAAASASPGPAQVRTGGDLHLFENRMLVPDMRKEAEERDRMHQEALRRAARVEAGKEPVGCPPF